MSDCTGEGLKAVLSLREQCPWLTEPVADERLQQAVDCVRSACLFFSISDVFVLQGTVVTELTPQFTPVVDKEMTRPVGDFSLC